MSDAKDEGGDCTEHRTAVTEAEVDALVQGICFKTGPPRTLGWSWSGSSMSGTCHSVP